MDACQPCRENADYDDDEGRRWFFRLYTDGSGDWLWEPREPSQRELSDVKVVCGVSWQPTVLEKDDWPPEAIRGPYAKRGDAITALEDWFGTRS